METQSDRLHPRNPICDAEKRPFHINRSSWDRQGWAYTSIRHRMGWDPSQDHSFSPVSSPFRFRQGPTNFFTGPDLPGPLSRGDAPVRDGSRSGRRDPQRDFGVLAQPRCRWPLEIAQRHLSSRSELCRKARPQSSIFTKASGGPLLGADDFVILHRPKDE